MSLIRVMVVDDSVVVRKIVTQVINNTQDMEVVGSAANGKIALTKIAQLNPDILTLDVEMPEMDGLETIREIRKTYLKLPVVMFSTLTEKGGLITLEALSAGASDYATKPTQTHGLKEAMEHISTDLVPKLRALVKHSKNVDLQRTNIVASKIFKPEKDQSFRPIGKDASEGFEPLLGGSDSIRLAPKYLPTPSINIIAIGVSTGGPNALGELLPKLPKDFEIPIVIVQHMPPMFTRLLAERLDKKCELEIREAQAGISIKPGRILIAPGGLHLGLKSVGSQVQTVLLESPPENSCRPSVDVLFRSVAALYGQNSLGVVLTGMGQDGLRGARNIYEAGGMVLAQDAETSVVWGMPGYVAKAGIACGVMSLENIAKELIKLSSEKSKLGLAL